MARLSLLTYQILIIFSLCSNRLVRGQLITYFNHSIQQRQVHQHDKAVNPTASGDISEDISYHDLFSSAQATDDVEDSYSWQDDDDDDDDDNYDDADNDDDNDDVIGSNYEKQYDDCDDLKMNEEPTHIGIGNLIYPNARITNEVSMLLIMTLAIVNKLSRSALKDLLSLIDLHCPVPYRLISSLYKFKQYFKALKHPPKKHYYCTQCSLSVTPDCIKCPNVLCNKEFTADSSKQFFAEIPITDQLKTFFCRKGFYQDLQHHFDRKNTNTLRDIYDGSVYKKLICPGKFSSRTVNISLTWNTDGIPVFKSSKYSIWPLYFVINELPISKRWCNDNIILAGLWFGTRKPNMLTFLKPFVEGLSELHSGVEMHSPDVSNNFLCKARLLCGTCDLPAKAMVFNMIQYNGYFGCTYCLQSGKQLATGERGTVHVYQYIQNNPAGPKHTTEQLEKDSREAIEKGTAVNGVKGPSWFSMVPNYNILEGNTVDYMHCVLLGVTKMLLKLWFDSEHSKEMWYCGTKVQSADSKLLQIKPPINITRTPRSIQHHRNYWKASEYRN